jgi:hypothetical protein
VVHVNNEVLIPVYLFLLAVYLEGMRFSGPNHLGAVEIIRSGGSLDM